MVDIDIIIFMQLVDAFVCLSSQMASMRLVSDIMFQHLFTAASHSVCCYSGKDDIHCLRMVCRTWRRWVDEAARHDPPVTLRTLTPEEQHGVVNALIGLHLPWSNLTDTYIHSVLSTTPSIRDPDDIPHLIHLLQHLYQRAVLAPATNIGTLDTTRVIERLTQARLSRFHSTGAASIQEASNLENLLHPQQSTKRSHMLIHLDGERVDIHSAQAVLNHIRGKILHTTLNGFIVAGIAPIIFIKSADALPPFVRRANPDGVFDKLITGVAIPIDPDAMVWHHHTILDIVRCLTLQHGKTSSGFHFIPLWQDGMWWIYVIPEQLCMLPISDGDLKWKLPLPSLDELVSGALWPSIADIFCADSSSVHSHFRLPILTKSGAQDILDWASRLSVVAAARDTCTPSTPTPSVVSSGFGHGDCARESFVVNFIPSNTTNLSRNQPPRNTTRTALAYTQRKHKAAARCTSLGGIY
jgi:hypothetical protein